MKVLTASLLIVNAVLCELPPPYLPRDFKPSQPLILPIGQPQRYYGAPDKFQSAAPQNFYGPPPRITNGGWSSPPRPSQPQTTYGAPSQISSSSPQQSYGAPSNRINNNPGYFGRIINNPEIIYGAPNRETVGPFGSSISQPQNTYGAPSKLNTPHSQYGAPNKHTFGAAVIQPQTSLIRPQNQYGAPNRGTAGPFGSSFSQPQTTYGAPTNLHRPQTQYGAPNTKDIETLERFRLSQLNYKTPSPQYLPERDTENFKGIGNSFLQSHVMPQQQYLPVKDSTNFRKGYDFSQNTNFGNTNGEFIEKSLSQQYLPVREASNFGRSLTANSPSHFFNPNTQSGGGSGKSIPSHDYIPSRDQSDLRQGEKSIPSQDYIPSRDQSDLRQGLDLPQNGIPNINNIASNDNFRPGAPTSNTETTTRNIFNTTPSTNYIPTQSTSPVPSNPRFTNNNQQSNVEIQEVNVRKIYPTVGPASNSNGIYQGVNGNGQSNQPVSDKYLPPATTARSVPTEPKRIPEERDVPTESTLPRENEPTTEREEKTAGPNVAIATAIASATPEQQFYLVQQDGRLQRVVYQRTQQPGDQENEYTANYFFQNIEQDPNAVYAPLVSLRK